MVQPNDVNSAIGSPGSPTLGAEFVLILAYLLAPQDHANRQLGLEVDIINFHALEVLVLGDCIHISRVRDS